MTLTPQQKKQHCENINIVNSARKKRSLDSNGNSPEQKRPPPPRTGSTPNRGYSKNRRNFFYL